MRRKQLGIPVALAAAMAVWMGGCATERASAPSKNSPKVAARRGFPDYCNPTAAKVKTSIITSSAPYVGMTPGERITYDPPERSESELAAIPNCPSN